MRICIHSTDQKQVFLFVMANHPSSPIKKLPRMIPGVPNRVTGHAFPAQAFPTGKGECAQREAQAKVMQEEIRKAIREGFEVGRAWTLRAYTMMLDDEACWQPCRI